MRARGTVRVRRLVQRGLTVGCGLAWWWAAVRLALAPDGRPGLSEGAVLTGWSLGLIPLHAVPVHPRISRDGRRGRAGPWPRRRAQPVTGPEPVPETGPAGALSADGDGPGGVQPPDGTGPL